MYCFNTQLDFLGIRQKVNVTYIYISRVIIKYKCNIINYIKKFISKQKIF